MNTRFLKLPLLVLFALSLTLPVSAALDGDGGVDVKDIPHAGGGAGDDDSDPIEELKEEIEMLEKEETDLLKELSRVVRGRDVYKKLAEDLEREIENGEDVNEEMLEDFLDRAAALSAQADVLRRELDELGKRIKRMMRALELLENG